MDSLEATRIPNDDASASAAYKYGAYPGQTSLPTNYNNLSALLILYIHSPHFDNPNT